ncbi:MAG: hypothetical protein IJ225_09005 [Solobacterium sp.]|nr:hypothetical protein [Solobacterium sp.]
MSFLTDFTNCSNSKLLYGGNGGLKAGIKLDGKNWIVKYPQEMFKYFGGTAKILTPDNLKTGITKNIGILKRKQNFNICMI